MWDFDLGKQGDGESQNFPMEQSSGERSGNLREEIINRQYYVISSSTINNYSELATAFTACGYDFAD